MLYSLLGGIQAVVWTDAIQVGIVDQALPTHRGARLLEVHAHQHLELRGVLAALFGEALGIRQRRGRIVNRAGSDHHQHAVGLAVQDLAHA